LDIAALFTVNFTPHLLHDWVVRKKGRVQHMFWGQLLHPPSVGRQSHITNL